MADDDITLDGKPLQSLRVADLKAALEQRNLPKTGQKNTLIKRLKGALMLENLQKSSSSHGGLQPNSQMGEEMSQNSFIKQYLAKQQELLRQRLEREAQQEEEEEADESSAVEERDHMDDNDDSAYVSEKHRLMASQPPLSRTEERQVGEQFPHGIMAFGSGMGSGATLHGAESREPPGAMLQRASFYQGHQEPPTPSPPRAVASLSVRVLGQPECQGLPPTVPRMQEKASTASSQSAHPVLHLSRSAGAVPAAAAREDSDEDDASNDDSDDDDWGPTASRRSSRVPPQPQPPSVPPASGRSKRKLQPPQHIPPPQLHSPLQLRHPTPPPSPPPNLFPLPDTPKQSPPDADHPVGEGSKMASFPPATMQGQESDSSSRSSSPEPPAKRRPGPLSLLVHKMESEQALDEAQSTSAADMSGEEAQAAARSDGAAGVSHSPLKKLEKRRQQENRDEKIRQEEKTKKEEEKKCLEEGRERKQLEEKEKKTDEKMKHQEKSRQEEKWTKREQTSEKDKMLYSSAQSLTEAQDSGSSSDSNLSSRSSYSSEKQSETTRKIKKGDQEQKKDGDGHIFLTSVEEKQHSTKREVSEPSAAAVTEEEPDSESAMALPPASGAEPENSEGPVEESTTPKAFAARKISLTTSNKMSPASAERGGEPETTNAAGRKRRWGSSTAVSAKKPSISITTDSLKSLIPDIKVNQEAVVDLPAEELQYSGDEETMDSTHEDQDNGLKIQRTVTQVVPSDSQKNGQGNEEEDGEKTDREKSRRASKDRRKDSVSEEATEPITSVKPEEEPKKVTPSDSLVRRSISQQKSGVSVTIDDPIRTNRKPSPPRGKVTNIIHVTNLVRPFTLGQLKELLNQTGSMVEDGFWIDKIKSHCYVTYSTAEEAASTRNALHGVKWPQSNPKVLSVDFCEQDEVDFHKGILKEKETDHAAPVPSVPQNRLPPLMPDRERDKDKDRERDRGMGGVRDLWAEREREMERRERARGEREWDRDKIREFARPGEDGRRSRSRDRDRRRRERAKSKERKTEKKEKADEPPAKLLDDLFLKTKAAPCIYWLPLTDEQAAQRVSDRTERQKERERIRKELDEEDKKKREEEKKERLKAREKEGGAVASGGGPARRVSEGDRDRDRGRDREGDRRRDSGHRPRRLSAGNARRSRSRSNPRERRR